VLVLRYYSGLSIAETAAALGIRPTAVTASTHRALRALMLEKKNIR
jgi:DNA-directed RNA polymerase specialized sigma24 family protein